MKIRMFSLLLTLLMMVCVCGCKTQPENLSNNVQVIETEEIVVDEKGNDITSSQDTILSNDNASLDTQTPVVDNGNDTVSSGNTSSVQAVKIDYDTVVEIDICNDIVRGYLDADDIYNQYYWLKTYDGQRFDYQNVQLDWVLDGSREYTVYFSQAADFSDAFTVKTDKTKQIKNTILVPGKTYYWRVIGSITDDALAGGKIKIKDAPVRWIAIDGIYNVRDMGGWKTESGKTVKYEMLYRGAQLNIEKDGEIINAVKDSGLEIFNKLGINTEFDIRNDSNVHIKPEGIDLNHVHVANHISYHDIFLSGNRNLVISNYKLIFNYLSDKSNYPIYTNCQAGADRTGTYAFLINGLLGVSYEDLTRDFELTSFAGNKRWRSAGSGTAFTDADKDLEVGNVTVSWRALYKGMMEYGARNGCTTLQQSIEHWFVNYIRIPQNQIDSFKSIMLE